MNPRNLMYEAARAVPVYPTDFGLASIAVFGFGVILRHFFNGPIYVMLAGILGWFAANTYWFVREVMEPQSSKAIVRRQFDRQQRAGGVASWLDIGQRGSRKALRLDAHYLRPSLQGTPLRQIDPNDVGVLLARTGFARWPLRHFQECWSGVRDVVMYVGGPGTNKTISLAEHGITTPGALVTTSTRDDLAKWVHRARKDRPVHVFNPKNKGESKSTVKWNVTEACDDYEVAQRRAIDLLPLANSPDTEIWFEKARLYLPVLLHCARIGGYDPSIILDWSRALSRDSGSEGVQRVLINLLDKMPEADHKIGLMRAFIAEPEKTRGSVNSMINQSLGWVASPSAREVGAAPLDEITLDIPKLLRNRETLHVIGHGKAGGPMTPLISALVAEINFQARMMAADMPGGRLDAPLTMILDEAAVTVRLPLDEWTSDAGGDGIHLIISVQSMAQLDLCWGAAGARTIRNNVGALVVFGGGKDARDLEDISALCGDFLATVVHPQLAEAAHEKGAQRDELKWTPVISVSQLANMLPGQAVVLKRGLGGAFRGVPPTVRMRKGWKPEAVAQVSAATPLQLVTTTEEEAAA